MSWRALPSRRDGLRLGMVWGISAGVASITASHAQTPAAPVMAPAPATPPAPAHEGRVQLPVPASLADALAQALVRQQPLVVMVSLPGCPFCRTVRDSHLGPLMADTGQPVVQIDMRSRRALRDFEGRATDHDSIVRGWGIGVAPTLLFIGRGGKEVAPRLAGASLPDFYGAYLDDRLAQARRAVLTG